MPDTKPLPGSPEAIREIAELMGWTEGKEEWEGYYWAPKGWLRCTRFNPFTNPAHTEMLMDRMRELGWFRDTVERPGVNQCRFWRPIKGEDFKANGDNWRTAVCMAAIETINV